MIGSSAVSAPEQTVIEPEPTVASGKNKKRLFIALILVLFVTSLVAAAYGLIDKRKTDSQYVEALQTYEAFNEDLKNKRLNDAYARTSAHFKEQYELSDFTVLTRQPPQSELINERYKLESTAQETVNEPDRTGVKLLFKATKEGEDSYSVTAFMVQNRGTWQIETVEIVPL